jgi:hypothetical protein
MIAVCSIATAALLSRDRWLQGSHEAQQAKGAVHP